MSCYECARATGHDWECSKHPSKFVVGVDLGKPGGEKSAETVLTANGDGSWTLESVKVVDGCGGPVASVKLGCPWPKGECTCVVPGWESK